MSGWEGRHQSTKHFEQLFEYEHLPPHLRSVSKVFHDAAHDLLHMVQDGPEMSTALRKLREAKDCAVTQAVIDKAAGKGVA
jgi:hypothetical protein